MTDSDMTPVDRPLALSDLNALKRVLHNVETVQLSMYEDFKSFRERIRYAIATCVGCAFVSLGCAVVSLVSRIP